MEAKKRKFIRFRGAVQGVGFRYRASYAAQSAGATGWVRNESDGSVTMEIQGTQEQIRTVLQTIERGAYIHIRNIKSVDIPIKEDEREFSIRDGWWY